MNGSLLSLFWAIPFCGILLSIAIIPLFAEKFWHQNYGKFSIFWTLMFLIPLIVRFNFHIAINEVIHILLIEYIPFITLLTALFIISSGIYIRGSFIGTPMVNSMILLIGSILSSCIGTTGTAMLLIRPMLRANKERQHRVHIVIFFIFLVANIGGILSPVGDPPLFIGFLNGVPFWWPIQNLFAPFIMVTLILLVIFFIIDTYYFRTETIIYQSHQHLGIEGKGNILLLLLLIVVVFASGVWKTHIRWTILHTTLELQSVIRNVVLIGIALASWLYTRKEIHKKNHFSWEPILEVIKLFFGIFITIAPVLAILHAGPSGALHFLMHILNQNNIPNNKIYFWLTGILSAFLDNAPTYMVFFHATGYDVNHLTTNLSHTLIAISLGSVFMGALTYIGNAPNFMVRSIAKSQKVRMPSFFGYMLWSCSILLPIFLLIEWIFL